MVMVMMLMMKMVLLLKVPLRSVLLAMQDLGGHLNDERERLAPFVSHEADGGGVDDSRQRPQEVVLGGFVADEVIRQVTVDLPVLLDHIREIDEESGAHVSFECCDVVLVCGPEIPDEQVAVFEQSSSPDFLRLLRCDQRVVKMIGSGDEVTEH